MKRLITYFLQGLIVIAPIAIIISVIYAIIMALGELFHSIGFEVHPYVDPIISLVAVLGIIVLTGYAGSTIIFKPIFVLLQKLMEKTPLVKIVYSSLKDLFSAFMGGKKKFSEPVLVEINKDAGLYKMGFITQKDLTILGLKDKVAVYLPHSYNFSGNMFIVARESVTVLEGFSSIDAMKFIVSGGVTNIASPGTDKKVLLNKG